MKLAMNIMKPDLVWIDGICCRVRNAQQEHKEHYNNTFTNADRSDLYDDEDEESGEEEEHFTTLNNGRVKASIPIAQSFLGYIIGTKGSTKKRLENETKTEIKIPPRGQSGDVFIVGPDRKNVSTALRRVKLIIIGARQKQSITHFISIPVTSTSIRDRCAQFKEEILESPWGKNIHPSIFIKPEKLHLTLLTMFLADEGERCTAKDILEKNCLPIILEHFEDLKDANFLLKGVSYMNDDPKAVNVLYANVLDNTLQLSYLTSKLKEAYKKTGFLIRNRESVNLHMTVMNTSQLLSDSGKVNEVFVKNKQFDASRILESYNNFEFGEQPLNEIHLSQIGSIDGNGYYKATGVVSL